MATRRTMRRILPVTELVADVSMLAYHHDWPIKPHGSRGINSTDSNCVGCKRAALLFPVYTVAQRQSRAKGGQRTSLSCTSLSSTERQEGQPQVSRDDPQRISYPVGLNPGGLRAVPVRRICPPLEPNHFRYRV